MSSEGGDSDEAKFSPMHDGVEQNDYDGGSERSFLGMQ
jgi:hypothetical protein